MDSFTQEPSAQGPIMQLLSNISYVLSLQSLSTYVTHSDTEHAPHRPMHMYHRANTCERATHSLERESTITRVCCAHAINPRRARRTACAQQAHPDNTWAMRLLRRTTQTATANRSGCRMQCERAFRPDVDHADPRWPPPSEEGGGDVGELVGGNGRCAATQRASREPLPSASGWHAVRSQRNSWRISCSIAPRRGERARECGADLGLSVGDVGGGDGQ